jgi:hypothetical protein
MHWIVLVVHRNRRTPWFFSAWTKCQLPIIQNDLTPHCFSWRAFKTLFRLVRRLRHLGNTLLQCLRGFLTDVIHGFCVFLS